MMFRFNREGIVQPLLLILAVLSLNACNQKQSLRGLPELSVPLGEAPESEPEPASNVETEKEPSQSSELPDPVALRVKQQYELFLQFDQGQVSVSRISSKLYPTAKLTERRLGRFAIEFWIGDELLERVRFNFPLLAVGSEEDHLESGLKTSAIVEVPFVERATRAQILDRQTQQTWTLDLPLRASEVAAAP